MYDWRTLRRVATLHCNNGSGFHGIRQHHWEQFADALAAYQPSQHPLTDTAIRMGWPDMDNPEGRAELRRQYDALGAKGKD